MLVDINTRGMEVAPLNDAQMRELLNAEKKINNDEKNREVYLLAVTRRN